VADIVERTLQACTLFSQELPEIFKRRKTTFEIVQICILLKILA